MEGVMREKWLGAHGLLYILLALTLFLLPRISLLVFLIAVALALIAGGVFTLRAGFSKSVSGFEKTYMIVIGVVDLLAGLAVIAWPDISALIILFMIAIRAIIRGFMGLIVAFLARDDLKSEGWLYLLEGISVAFGIYLLTFPGEGAIALAWLFSLYFLLTGLLELVLANKWGTATANPVREKQA